MNKQNIRQTLPHIALIACFALAVMSSSFYNGLTSGNDLHQHFQFASTIRDSIVSGEFYPSFAAAPNHGYESSIKKMTLFLRACYVESCG